jgi:hypothetical protein
VRWTTYGCIGKTLSQKTSNNNENNSKTTDVSSESQKNQLKYITRKFIATTNNV